MQFENPFGMAELIELGGSAAVVLLMIGVAAVLGFRMSARIDEGELTRTRKLRREFITQRYKQLVEELYRGSSSAALEIPITYQDGRKGTLSAVVRINDVEDGFQISRPRDTTRAIA